MISLFTLFCGYLCSLGWILSALRQLHAAGYFVGILCFPVFLIILQVRNPLAACRREVNRLAVRWRNYLVHRRWQPLLLGLLLIFLCLGGSLYAPTNYDGLCYRVPRMLHWLADQQWNWITTVNTRMNYMAVSSEWISMPLLAIFRSDRLLFVPNLIGWSLIPSLFFSIAIRLGVRRRVAWVWMWIFPTGYGFILQAASICSDILGVIFFLIAIDYALRFQKNGDRHSLIVSLIAAGLCTGIKLSNVPLALPWLILLLPGFLKFRAPRPWVGLLLAAAVAISASFLPIALANYVRSGDPTGQALSSEILSPHNPAAGVIGNTILLGVGNLAPPVMPNSGGVAQIISRLLPKRLHDFLAQNFEGGFNNLSIGEIQVEEAAGFGLGLVSFLIVSLAYGRKIPARHHLFNIVAFGFASALAAVVYCAKLGSYQSARIFLPYYGPLCLVALTFVCFTPGRKQTLLSFWSALVFAGAFLVVALTPARPLFPVLTLLNALPRQTESPNLTLTRIGSVYRIYRQRNGALSPLLAAIPSKETEIGLVTNGNDLEASLWRPFGERRVKNVIVTPSGVMNPPTPQYMVLGPTALSSGKVEISQILKICSARVIATIDITETVTSGVETWYVLRSDQDDGPTAQLNRSGGQRILTRCVPEAPPS
jgi:hypothetical protein